MVSQPLAPFLDPIIVSGSLHVYVSQSARGELVMGGAVDSRPYTRLVPRLCLRNGLSAHMLELFRFWAASNYCDSGGYRGYDADFSPIMGERRLPITTLTPVGELGALRRLRCAALQWLRPSPAKSGGNDNPLCVITILEMDLVGEKGAAASGH